MLNFELMSEAMIVFHNSKFNIQHSKFIESRFDMI